jgi:PIN domain nuclease of toxin-antitoxin system
MKMPFWYSSKPQGTSSNHKHTVENNRKLILLISAHIFWNFDNSSQKGKIIPMTWALVFVDVNCTYRITAWRIAYIFVF